MQTYNCTYADPIVQPGGDSLFSTSSCTLDPGTIPLGDPVIIYQFTEGEIIISFFLFLIFVTLFFSGLYNRFTGMRLKTWRDK
jgi:hypothetical protein